VSVHRLPENPNLEHLRKLARSLQRRVRAGDADAVALAHEHHPRVPAPARFTRSDALLVIARRYGFPSWPRLHAHVSTVAGHSRSPHRAASSGRVDRFLSLACLTYGADASGRLAAARRMLDEDAGLAAATIHTAAATGAVATLRDMLAADPSLANTLGGPHRWPPLLYLAFARITEGARGHAPLEAAEVLLDAGADPAAGYLWSGLTPPFTAVTGALGMGEDAVNQPPHPDGFALARRLFAAGADANDAQALYNRRSSPDDAHLDLLLSHGLGRGDGGVWHARLAPAHPSPQQIVEEELRWSAAMSRADRVRMLLAVVDDVDGLGDRHPLLADRTACEHAALLGDAITVELLVRAGARRPQPGALDLLRGACLSGDRDAVERLVSQDATLPGRLIAREPTLIDRAAELGRTGAVPILAGLGFDLSPTDRPTPLHVAAFAGHLEVVRALVAAGADPYRREPGFDATALEWAQHNQQHEVAVWLAERMEPARE